MNVNKRGALFDWLCDQLPVILKEALFPTRCLICGGLYRTQGRLSEKETVELVLSQQRAAVFAGLMAVFLCPVCRNGFTPVESPLCTCCGMLFGSREGEDHICSECLQVPRHFDKARSAGIYGQALMESIHCFKYKEKIQLGMPLGMLLLATLLAYWKQECFDLVVPVPLHIKKLRKRGFNQSWHLVQRCDRLLRAMDLTTPYLQVAPDLLIRARPTEPQTGLGRRQRIGNVKNAFRLNGSKGLSAKRVLLVDDVYTTGATVNECARTLKRGGADRVDVLTLARAV